MKRRKNGLIYAFEWLIPVFIIAFIEIIKFFPFWIENKFSTGFYVGFSRALRMFTGWIPFSIGDILYILFGFAIAVRIFRELAILFSKQYSWQRLFYGLLYVIRKCLWLYIWFYLAWGLNYYRPGIASQLGLSRSIYHKEDVTRLTDQIIQKANDCRRQLKDTILPQPSMDAIFKEATVCYDNISREKPFLIYQNRSIKSSLYSPLGNYFGFTGYYNPFSGESQVRNDVPRLLIPFIACHEMAHQLGYASESEANFVGYMASASSRDVFFRYSVYQDLFSYAQGEEIKMYLAERDTSGLKAVLLHNRNALDTLVKKDRKEIREFFYKRENKVSPLVSSVYDQYLKLNKQMDGIKSYNDVIGWLLAYQKKEGKL